MKTIIFDLDGTLALSKQPIDAEMATCLARLLDVCNVAIISGGSYEQFQKQVVSRISATARFENLLLLPVTGSMVYRYENKIWKQISANNLTPEEKVRITEALQEAEKRLELNTTPSYGEKIEDRITQITYSGLGQNAPLNAKQAWDPDQAKRISIMNIIAPQLPDFDIHCGGMTSIDITHKGVDKASGIYTVQKTLGTTLSDITFVGDAIFPGGNDYPATTTGVTCIKVASVTDTKKLISKIVADSTPPSRSQIVATLGPASAERNIFFKMIEANLDVVRLNFSWGNYTEKSTQIKLVKEARVIFNRVLPIIIDLPGPRIQQNKSHSYDKDIVSCLTPKDREHIQFGIKENIDWIALSFVGSAQDIAECRAEIQSHGGTQKIIAKIERAKAIDNLDEIIAATDAVMVARGDLGNEIELEKIPFVEADIIKKCNAAKKPVITATQMMLSMTENPIPTRAEVTDVTAAILLGSDAVMLSEETAAGKYPVEAVAMMEKILLESESHSNKGEIHPL